MFPMSGPGSGAGNRARDTRIWRRTGPGSREAGDTVKRIRSLAIPPAWTEVWICPHADGHIQAIGRDAKGRKQYRYHALFREVRESTKYEHVVAFADALPAIRAKVREHMGLRGLPREKVLATVVHLLETTLIRVGNDDYARQNKSYGLTTLRKPPCESSTAPRCGSASPARAESSGRSQVKDRRVAKIIKACQELPGQDLLQYVDADGNVQDVTLQRREYLPARKSPGWKSPPRISAPGPEPCWRPLALKELESFDSAAPGEAKSAVGDRARRRTPGQHADHLPKVLRPSGSAELVSRRRSRPGDQVGGRKRAARRTLGLAAGGSSRARDVADPIGASDGDAVVRRERDTGPCGGNSNAPPWWSCRRSGIVSSHFKRLTFEMPAQAAGNLLRSGFARVRAGGHPVLSEDRTI